MAEPMIEFVEISDALIAKIAEADKRIDELSDQLRGAEYAKQSLLDEAVAGIAAFKVGQEVSAYGKRYRITKVQGEKFGLHGHRPKVWLRYFGERLKVNGESMGRQARLYEISAITTNSDGSWDQMMPYELDDIEKRSEP